MKKLLVAVIAALTVMTMKSQKSYIFYADGVEEVEAVATVDALRRGGLEVVTVAVGDSTTVTGATGQKLIADALIGDVDMSDAQWIIIPGGVPGAPNLHANARVNEIIKTQWARGGKIASICAGPAVVLAPTGILKGMKATCYPGLGNDIESAGGTYVEQPVVVDGNLITSEGPGTTLQFAGAIISATLGPDKARETLSSMLAGE